MASTGILDASITRGPLPEGLYLATGLIIAVLLVRRYGPRTALGLGLGASLVGGGAFGWLLAWLLSDVWQVFGISLSTTTRLWVAAGCAGVSLAIASLRRTRWWRKALAIALVPLCLLCAAAGINADFGQFPSLRAAVGLPMYPSLRAALASPAGSGTGVVGTVTIPSTVSGFPARPALVYLPPAARTRDAPRLPVIEMLSGQPGSPADVFTAGRIAGILDAFAATHAGLAPIVVVPDQLGAPEKNPMCVDSALGDTATYLTVDVPTWIRTHLRVAAAPAGWTIAGFSQGGTCSIQLGAAHPALFGTVFDISGELAPHVGSAANSIASGFAGSQAAFAAAAPAAVLAAHAPYPALSVILAVGADDARYRDWAATLGDAAERAGARTRLIVSPGTGHDWHTVRYAWTNALPIIARRTGLAGPAGPAAAR